MSSLLIKERKVLLRVRLKSKWDFLSFQGNFSESASTGFHWKKNFRDPKFDTRRVIWKEPEAVREVRKLQGIGRPPEGGCAEKIAIKHKGQENC